MKMDESWYAEWYSQQATNEEKLLIDKVYEFESYFDDMLFQKDTSTYDLIKCKSKSQNNDEMENNKSEADKWVDDMVDLPEQLTYFSYSFFHFKVAPTDIDNCCGYFNEPEQTITITPEYFEDDKTILHEMIHLHEFVINDLPLYYHDMVYWSLYKDLRNKIPKLDEIITGHTHLLTSSILYSSGGLHDVLFMLKSIDLDIRMKYPLGTVFAYGRDIELKNYSYMDAD